MAVLGEQRDAKFRIKNLMFLLILLMLIQPVQAQAYSEVRDDALVCMDATQKFEKSIRLKNTYSLPSRVSKQEDGTPRQSKKSLGRGP